MIKKICILLVLLIPISFHYQISSSYACSCVQPGSALDELDKRDFVFSGKVKNMVDPKKNEVILSSADPITIHFDVKEVWKGINESEVLVVTERDSASCGFNFVMNEEYLVYGNMIEGKKHVSVCSKTTLLNEATADLNELGEGKLPTEIVTIEYDEDEGTNSGNQQDSSVIWIVLLSVFVSILISISYLLVRKKKR